MDDRQKKKIISIMLSARKSIKIILSKIQYNENEINVIFVYIVLFIDNFEQYLSYT